MIDIPLSINLASEYSETKKTEFFSFLYNVVEDWVRGTNPIILIVGRSQMGKSTTASIIVTQLLKKLPMLNFDPDLHIASKVENFLEMIVNNQNTILVNEESEDELYSGNWNTLENKMFHKVLVSQGKQHNIYILILHRFNDLDKRNRLKINWLVTQIARGYALVQSVDNRPNDPTDEIKLSPIRKWPSLKYDKDSINWELWSKWDNVVCRIKDTLADESIKKIKKKHGKNIYNLKELDLENQNLMKKIGIKM